MADANAISMGSLGIGSGAVTNEALAVVSHDLRIPISIISIGAALLDRGQHTAEERASILRTIQRATDRMDRLVKDLLTHIRIDGGCAITVTPATMDVGGLLAEVREAFAHPAQVEGRRLECRIPEALPAVYADRDRVYQVLGNLVGNALKFTPPGGTVALEAEPHRYEVRCSVSDTGPGMTEAELERVFDPFWQAEKRAGLGFGLGLKIAKCIVEAHGGTMKAESVPGTGSRFSFTLPLADREASR
jgi:signal transduction histidine kinase